LSLSRPARNRIASARRRALRAGSVHAWLVRSRGCRVALLKADFTHQYAGLAAIAETSPIPYGNARTFAPGGHAFAHFGQEPAALMLLEVMEGRRQGPQLFVANIGIGIGCRCVGFCREIRRRLRLRQLRFRLCQRWLGPPHRGLRKGQGEGCPRDSENRQDAHPLQAMRLRRGVGHVPEYPTTPWECPPKGGRWPTTARYQNVSRGEKESERAIARPVRCRATSALSRARRVRPSSAHRARPSRVLCPHLRPVARATGLGVRCADFPPRRVRRGRPPLDRRRCTWSPHRSAAGVAPVHAGWFPCSATRSCRTDARWRCYRH